MEIKIIHLLNPVFYSRKLEDSSGLSMSSKEAAPYMTPKKDGGDFLPMLTLSRDLFSPVGQRKFAEGFGVALELKNGDDFTGKSGDWVSSTSKVYLKVREQHTFPPINRVEFVHIFFSLNYFQIIIKHPQTFWAIRRSTNLQRVANARCAR